MKNAHIYYLRWDEDSSLIEGLISGKVYSKEDYEPIIDISFPKEKSDEYILENIFADLNDNYLCYTTRSMSVGDIIQIDNDFYVVKPIGFKKIK